MTDDVTLSGTSDMSRKAYRCKSCQKLRYFVLHKSGCGQGNGIICEAPFCNGRLCCMDIMSSRSTKVRASDNLQKFEPEVIICHCWYLRDWACFNML